MKLIEDIINRNVKQVINEYADKKYIINLYNYLKNKNYVKNKEHNEKLIYNGFDYLYTLFEKFLEQEDVSEYNINKDEYVKMIHYNNYKIVDKILKNKYNIVSNDFYNKISNNDYTLIDDILYGKFSFLKDFILERLNYNLGQPNMFKDPIFLNGHWLIHFSDNAKEIAQKGFVYGAPDVEEVSFTSGKLIEEGYNFAFDTDDFEQFYNNRTKYSAKITNYGDNAVLFKADGVKTYHRGDKENQVIFWGPSAKNFIYLEHKYINNKDIEWVIKSIKTNKVLYHNTDIKNVVDWAINNYDQYQKSMIDYKGNERFRRYETNYNSPKNNDFKYPTWNKFDFKNKTSIANKNLNKKFFMLNKTFTSQDVMNYMGLNKEITVHDRSKINEQIDFLFIDYIEENCNKIFDEYKNKNYNKFLKIEKLETEDLFISNEVDNYKIYYRPKIDSYFIVIHPNALKYETLRQIL